ncbi:hypothetical protein V8E54_013942 [Elaphomyces granulatus]
MPMTWDNHADAKLLVGILKVAKPKIDFNALAKYMGPDCTAYALRHRIRRLEARAAGDDSVPSTPQKRKRNTKSAANIDDEKLEDDKTAQKAEREDSDS